MTRRSLLFLIIFQAVIFGQAKHIVVIAHRGEHLHHPENTIAAFQGAVEAGADFFELDVRTTSDGKLVLMHDGTVERTTNGKGDVARMTYDQIRELKTGAGSQIPSFDEALAFAHGKIGVYVDSKRISARAVVSAVLRNHMQDHVLIYGDPEYLQEVAALQTGIKVMPEAGNPRTLRALLEALPLKVVAFDAKDFNPETLAVALEAKVDIYVDRLGGADNPASWQDAINRGATGIQTDHPAELVEYLKASKYR